MIQIYIYIYIYKEVVSSESIEARPQVQELIAAVERGKITERS